MMRDTILVYSPKLLQTEFSFERQIINQGDLAFDDVNSFSISQMSWLFWLDNFETAWGQNYIFNMHDEE